MHLSTDRIIKHFDSFSLGPVSLEIKSGITAITGRSGSGKTTLLMLLSGLVAPDSGAVLLNGSRIKGIPSSFGLVMQHPERQLFADTVIDDVSFSLKRMKFSKSEKREMAEEALSMMGIGRSKWDISPFFLSGGERRRAAIAGVIVSKPSVLFLDEPYSGLDNHSIDRVNGVIDRVVSSDGIVVMVNHDDEMIPPSASVVVMDKGRVIGTGSRMDCGIFNDSERFSMLLRAQGYDVPLAEDDEALIEVIRRVKAL